MTQPPLASFQHTHFGHFLAFGETLVYSGTEVHFHFNNSSIGSFRSFLCHVCGKLGQYSPTKTQLCSERHVNGSDVRPIRGKNKTAVHGARRTQQGTNQTGAILFYIILVLSFACTGFIIFPPKIPF